jgi:hypothetical protein
VRRCTRRTLQQGVEAIEIEVDELRVDSIRLCLRDNERARVLAVRGEATPEHRDERLKRATGMPRGPLPPELLGKPYGRDPVPPRGEEELEHLLGSNATQVAGTDPSPVRS